MFLSSTNVVAQEFTNIMCKLHSSEGDSLIFFIHNLCL